MESLNGQRILITRSADDMAATVEKVRQRGGIPVPCPVIEIIPPDDVRPLDDAITTLNTFHWILFTSANSVRFFFQRFEALAIDPEIFKQLKIAAIGPSTAKELSNFNQTAQFMADKATGSSFVEEFVNRFPIASQKFLFPCSDIAHKTVPGLIRKHGGEIIEAVAYCNKPIEELPAGVIEKIKKETIDWAFFTSPSTVNNFYVCLERYPDIPQTFHIASIGPTTTSALMNLGKTPNVEADPHTLDGLLDAIVFPSHVGEG